MQTEQRRKSELDIIEKAAAEQVDMRENRGELKKQLWQQGPVRDHRR
jgi:hypothetical protein